MLMNQPLKWWCCCGPGFYFHSKYARTTPLVKICRWFEVFYHSFSFFVMFLKRRLKERRRPSPQTLPEAGDNIFWVYRPSIRAMFFGVTTWRFLLIKIRCTNVVALSMTSDYIISFFSVLLRRLVLKNDDRNWRSGRSTFFLGKQQFQDLMCSQLDHCHHFSPSYSINHYLSHIKVSQWWFCSCLFYNGVKQTVMMCCTPTRIWLQLFGEQKSTVR